MANLKYRIAPDTPWQDLIILKGDPATINGVNILEMLAGENIVLSQENNQLTINSEIPIATENTLGGIKAAPKTAEMTQPIGIDSDGRLYVDIGINKAGQLFATSINNPAETIDHSTLINRNAPNQHPILAITGLQDKLDNKVSKNGWTGNKILGTDNSGNIVEKSNQVILKVWTAEDVVKK